MLDFHNHLMPAVDDGAIDIDESRAGLEMLRNQGVIGIITTPHVRGSITSRPRELELVLKALDDAWNSLRSLADADFPELRLERGVEVLLDIPRPILDDPRLRLAGTSYVLAEFPFTAVPPNSRLAIRNIGEQGFTPIIAHPERYANLPNIHDLVDEWRDAGAYIQVNSGSLLGYYGSVPRRIAWTILERGRADYLSSDYHSRGKCAVAECARLLKAVGGGAQHRELTSTNPRRLLANLPPLPVPPLERGTPSLWKRLLPW